ncbi:MAG: hypothetical protein OD814_001856 [Candidatus Alkanophagales archaeon MCA70_species_1]|nr:hypothetical protein [Candidatus Alkanophaga volatiphilum]
MHLQENKITTILEELRGKGVEPESIILFGSFAKENYTGSSDIDVLIVLRRDMDWFDRQPLVSGADVINTGGVRDDVL